jgi:aspartate kinase
LTNPSGRAIWSQSRGQWAAAGRALGRHANNSDGVLEQPFVALLIQKFGGTSVADPKKILAAAARAIRAHQMGFQVVVVVSARGHTTDELIATAREISSRPSAREMDMLLSTGEQVSVALMAMAIQSMGVPAISFTGAQIGLVTDSFHSKARIRAISTTRMHAALEEGKIVIVAGFQGIDENDDITTLGRGGSDTTAVALAAVLKADACEIYTDVEGVYTTDPRVVPEARKIDRISYDEMLELASLGAGVMHSRSIEFAKKFHVPIHVRSAMSEAPGTWIVADADARQIGSGITGAALASDEARVTVQGVPDRPGAVYALFRRIAEANIAVDMIVQNAAAGGTTDISFTVAGDDLEETLRIASAAAHDVGAECVAHDADVAKVSVIGLRMRTHAGVAATMFNALAEAGIAVQVITTSEIKISTLVSRACGKEALRAIHRAFELARPVNDSPIPFTPRLRPRPSHSSANGAANGAAAAPFAAMEDMVISGIELDDRQARITIPNVSDRPDEVAGIFDRLAGAGALVDMIVKNAAREGHSSLSFTVRREDAGRAAEAARAGKGRVEIEPAVAKLSLTGVGIRTHTGVATCMFNALAEGGINIALIFTSEVRINILTNLDRGREARQCLERAFLPQLSLLPHDGLGTVSFEDTLPSLASRVT